MQQIYTINVKLFYIDNQLNYLFVIFKDENRLSRPEPIDCHLILLE